MANTLLTVNDAQQDAEIASLIAELDEYFDMDPVAVETSKDSIVSLIAEIDKCYKADPIGSLIVEMDEYFNPDGIGLYSDREDGFGGSIRRFHAKLTAS